MDEFNFNFKREKKKKRNSNYQLPNHEDKSQLNVLSFKVDLAFSLIFYIVIYTSKSITTIFYLFINQDSYNIGRGEI